MLLLPLLPQNCSHQDDYLLLIPVVHVQPSLYLMHLKYLPHATPFFLDTLSSQLATLWVFPCLPCCSLFAPFSGPPGPLPAGTPWEAGNGPPILVNTQKLMSLGPPAQALLLCCRLCIHLSLERHALSCSPCMFSYKALVATYRLWLCLLLAISVLCTRVDTPQGRSFVHCCSHRTRQSACVRLHYSVKTDTLLLPQCLCSLSIQWCSSPLSVVLVLEIS